MPPTLRVDWFRVIVDLSGQGFSLRDMADQIGSPHQTILDWKLGAEPRHADGERLVAFWSAATGRGRDDLPRVGDMPSAARAK